MAKEKKHSKKRILIHENSLEETLPGVLHEIGTPLVIIRNTVYLLKKELLEKNLDRDFLLENLAHIDEALDYIQDVTVNLKKLKHSSPVTCVNLSGIITKAIDFLNFRDITFITNLDESVEVRANSGKLLQVFTNIIKNAQEALAGQENNLNKTISISLQYVDDQSMVTITDNGPGMTEETLKNLFVPFYTTKDEGTGIGMSIVNSILDQHGGSIKVSSELGKGTTFIITFKTTN